MTPTALGSITQFATPPPQPQYIPHQQQYVPQPQQYLTPQQQIYGQQPVMPQQQYAQLPVVQTQPVMQQQYMQATPAQNAYHPQQPQRAPTPQQPPVQSNAAEGSFAARSAAAYAVVGLAPQQPSVIVPQQQACMVQQSIAPAVPTISTTAQAVGESPALQAQQNRILTDCTRKVQEHAYYMKQAMEKDDLPTVLERAVSMLGELGDGTSSQLTPKNYYELHMRALDDMPNLEEFLIAVTSSGKQKMRELYDQVQYCPRVLPRLYLQICAGSALIRSKEESAKWVLADLIDGVKCVQNPVRGLFLRHFLLQVTRDKLPYSEDVKDAYEFVLTNFIEMNKLWVRIQHLPGDGKTKDQRKRRERERNELRILVGTNLVRLSQLEGVSSQIYGEQILPKILEQITVCGDPLAQAYLIDCIIQVFPDEYHIETLPVLLAVCPKLRDKVNIRTILQSLMDRLANYYAEEELLDEVDTNQVKKSMAKDSFPMFEECVQKVYNARGPKLVAKEVIRLQTALLNFSLKCNKDNMEQVSRCLRVCDQFVRQAGNAASNYSTGATPDPGMTALDDASVVELEKMLSIPLESLALKVLELDQYSGLLQFLPWNNRRDVGITMLRAIDTSGGIPQTMQQIEELFAIIAPVIREESSSIVDQVGKMKVSPGLEQAERSRDVQEEITLLSKLVHSLNSEDDELAFEMLSVARNHLSTGGPNRVSSTLVPIVFSALQLATRMHGAERKAIEEIKNQNTKAIIRVEDDSAIGITHGAVSEAIDEKTVAIQQSAGEGEELIIEETKLTTEETELTTGEGELTTEEKESTADFSIDATKKIEEPCITTLVPQAMEQSTEENKEVLPVSIIEATQEMEGPEGVVPTEPSKSVSCRKIFVFLQSTVAMVAKGHPELGVNLYIDLALAADGLAVHDKGRNDSNTFTQIAYELMTQGILLHEEDISDAKSQERSIIKIIGALIAFETLSNDEYERLITKAAQFSAKLVRKQEQCRMVALCAHLFYPGEGKSFQNPPRSLECLQRALKLADSSTCASAGNVYLFVELLDHYVCFFEERNPVVSEVYITGLVALIREHLDTVIPITAPDISAVSDAKAHFSEVLQHIKRKKNASETAERFTKITL